MSLRLAVVISQVYFAGCTTGHYRSETTLHSDGSVSRTIYQPSGSISKKPDSPGAWKTVRDAASYDSSTWPGFIDDVPAPGEDPGAPYTVAKGTFPTVGKLPAHYVRKLAGEKHESTFVRKSGRNDYVFVVEHSWSETLTDTVTLDGIRKSRRDLATLLISLADDSLREGLPDHDASKLMAWLKSEGTEWFIESIDLYVDSTLRAKQHKLSRQKAGKKFEADFVKLCAKHDLQKLNEEDAVADFVKTKLKSLLRKRDGSPPSEFAVQSILYWINLKQDETRAEDDETKTPLEQASESIIKRKHGGKEAFEKRVASLVEGIVGLYGPLSQNDQFDYRMSMPGRIVETTGTLDDEGAVTWSFTGGEVFPFGYVMSCRSLEAKDKLQKKLLGGTPLAGRKSLTKYIDIVAGDDNLRRVLRDCVKKGNLDPLREYRTVLDIKKEEDKLERLTELWALLKLPA
jgi:hypothetical protein